MSSREFAEWMAYERVTGLLGPERDDLLHAILASMVYNQGAKKPRPPKDFLPQWDQSVRRQSPQEMLSHLQMLTVIHGGRIDSEQED